GDVGPHVHPGGLVHVRMPELEDDFRIADGESVLVGDAQAQDEGVVVELEVPRIEEENLADTDVPLSELLRFESHPVLLRSPGDLVPEFQKALRRDDSVRLEDDLAFQELNRVERMTVAVLHCHEVLRSSGTIERRSDGPVKSLESRLSGG